MTRIVFFMMTACLSLPSLASVSYATPKETTANYVHRSAEDVKSDVAEQLENSILEAVKAVEQQKAKKYSPEKMVGPRESKGTQ